MNKSISFPFVNVAANNAVKSVENQPNRITLNGHETYKLPANAQSLLVVSGTAWVTAYGVDYVLRPYSPLTLPTGTNDAVISGTGREAVMIDIRMN